MAATRESEATSDEAAKVYSLGLTAVSLDARDLRTATLPPTASWRRLQQTHRPHAPTLGISQSRSTSKPRTAIRAAPASGTMAWVTSGSTRRLWHPNGFPAKHPDHGRRHRLRSGGRFVRVLSARLFGNHLRRRRHRGLPILHVVENTASPSTNCGRQHSGSSANTHRTTPRTAPTSSRPAPKSPGFSTASFRSTQCTSTSGMRCPSASRRAATAPPECRYRRSCRRRSRRRSPTTPARCCLPDRPTAR